ncbi:hypothetical protein BGZ76_001520, partial [Entomortierella beljakovae]
MPDKTSSHHTTTTQVVTVPAHVKPRQSRSTKTTKGTFKIMDVVKTADVQPSTPTASSHKSEPTKEKKIKAAADTDTSASVSSASSSVSSAGSSVSSAG